MLIEREADDREVAPADRDDRLLVDDERLDEDRVEGDVPTEREADDRVLTPVDRKARLLDLPRDDPTDRTIGFEVERTCA